MPTEGKRAEGPCGHVGHYVIGQFWLCDVKGCSGLGNAKICQRCGGKMSPFVAASVPEGTWSCDACGKIRWEPGWG